jgi:hypothetical protein
MHIYPVALCCYCFRPRDPIAIADL